MYRLLIKHPHITEKAGDLAHRNQYVFIVDKSATKPSVKRAVEEVYGVKVISVNILNRPRPATTFRFRQSVKKSKIKKAVVTVKEGDRIDIIPQ